MRGTERERHRQREKQAPCGAWCRTWSQDPRITTWAKGRCSVTEPPRYPVHFCSIRYSSCCCLSQNQFPEITLIHFPCFSSPLCIFKWWEAQRSWVESYQYPVGDIYLNSKTLNWIAPRNAEIWDEIFSERECFRPCVMYSHIWDVGNATPVCPEHVTHPAGQHPKLTWNLKLNISSFSWASFTRWMGTWKEQGMPRS